MANNSVCGWPRTTRHALCYCAVALALSLTSSWAWPASADRWEGFNRGVHDFNDRVDRALLKPVAQTYDRVLPAFLKRGIHNVFRNLGTPAVAINQFLQGKPGRGMSDTARVLVNTTFGIGGLFDVASSAGLRVHDEDFGQTLQVWGAPAGPFFVVPFRGPATVTHACGMLVSSFMSPLQFVSPQRDRYAIRAGWAIDSRVQLLKSEVLVSGDRYLFFREAYLQRREFLTNDGVVFDDPFIDDEFEDFDQ